MHVLYVLKYAYQVLDVVAVHRSEIPYVHTLEHVVLVGELYLDVVVAAYDLTAALLRHESQLVKHA